MVADQVPVAVQRHSTRRVNPRPATRVFMEPRFGHDFARVRVYADDRAAKSARALNALAYTVAPNIVFGSGQYAPQTDAGRSLVAHSWARCDATGDGLGKPSFNGRRIRSKVCQDPKWLIFLSLT